VDLRVFGFQMVFTVFHELQALVDLVLLLVFEVGRGPSADPAFLVVFHTIIASELVGYKTSTFTYS